MLASLVAGRIPDGYPAKRIIGMSVVDGVYLVPILRCAHADGRHGTFQHGMNELAELFSITPCTIRRRAGRCNDENAKDSQPEMSFVKARAQRLSGEADFGRRAAALCSKKPEHGHGEEAVAEQIRWRQ